MTKKAIIYIVHPIVLIGIACFPIKSFSADWKTVKLPGNSSVHISWDNSREVVDRFGRNGDFYGFRRIEPSIIEHAPTGARSTTTIPATVQKSVSRKAVLGASFGIVKAGAKLASRAVPYVGWGLLAHDAYQLVKGDLESQGYYYDEAKEEFYKDWAARSCIWERDDEGRAYDVDCFGVDSSITRHQTTDDPKKQKEIKYLMEAQMERLARPYWKQKQKILADGRTVIDWNKYIFDKCYFNWNGGSCNVKKGSDERAVIHFALKMNQRELLTPQKFLEIATPKIDSNPTPFVEASNRPGYKEDVEIESGKVVVLGPITGGDGKPVQVTVTFGRDSNGNTTADAKVTGRPDITPGSPAAPKTNPTPTPGDNGKPDGQPNKTPDDNPKDNPKPDPDDSPSGKDKSKPEDKPDPDGKDDPEDEKPKEDGGLLCKVFPNILACDEQPDSEEPDLKIPEQTIDLNFSKDNAFQEHGECPKPVTFEALGSTYRISIQPACDLAVMLRPIIIAFAWLMAAFFVTKTVKDNI